MAYTVQQKRMVDKVVEVLVQQRENLRITAVALKAELDQYNSAAQVRDKALGFSSTMGNVLTKLNSNSAEILTAAGLVGVSDFTSRYNQLNDAKTLIDGSTTGNIGTRLQTIITNLPVETIF